MAGKSHGDKRIRNKGNPLSDLLLKIGRAMSPTKAKEPELWGIWNDTLTANGVRTSDRMKELIAWDVQNNGQNLGAYDMLKREGDTQKEFNKMSEIGEMAKIAKQQIMQNVNSEVEHQKQMHDMNTGFMNAMDQFNQTVNNLSQQIQQLQQSPQRNKS